MNPYQKALKQKKFEGLKIEISPINREDMEDRANNGDAAPDVLDDPNMDLEDKPAEGGTMADERPEPAAEDESAGMSIVQPEDVTSEDVFGAAAPEGKAMSLREKAMQRMKRKK